MWVGGEFYYDDRWLLAEPALNTDGMVFLNGGKACLIVIAGYLRSRGIDRVLLPAYLCPTIVNTLESCGIRCLYYPVKPDLTIDPDELERRVSGYRAVLFINYFGFQHNEETRAYLRRLRQRGVFVVEDNAQAGFATRYTGDFVFNSVRKLAPFDGGYLITPHNVSDLIEHYPPVQNRRLPLIREYRQQLGEYRYRGTGSHEKLSQLYTQTEQYYEEDFVVMGDPLEREQIEHLDWPGIKRARRGNFNYLLELISEIPSIMPVFPLLQADNMPMGLPVYIEGISRDWLFDQLGDAGIGLTVHWDAPTHDPRLNSDPVAVDMASRMLTLVIDQRTNHKQLDYLADRLSSFLKEN